MGEKLSPYYYEIMPVAGLLVTNAESVCIQYVCVCVYIHIHIHTNTHSYRFLLSYFNVDLASAYQAYALFLTNSLR